jgi:multidrug efflux pump subunit AcrB
LISNFFIDRPLFATVVSAFIVIAGLAAFRELRRDVSEHRAAASPS